MSCKSIFMFLLVSLLLYQVYCLKTIIGCPLKQYLSNPLKDKEIKQGFDCHKRQCDEKLNCAICFQTVKKECYLSLLPWELLEWDYKWDQRVIREPSTNIFQIWGSAPKNPVSRQPTVLWMLDEFSKGINFGKATHFLDIPIPQVSTVWAGPRPYSTLKFARSTTAIKLSLFQKTSLLFDFSDQFTIAMWINTKSLPAGDFVLFDTVPKAGFKLMLFPGGERSSLAFGTGSMLDGGDYISTKKNYTKINEWRHIAIISYKKNTVFFLEGSKWPIDHWNRKEQSRLQPLEILLWSDGDLGSQFRYKGSYACVAMFQTAVNVKDIQALRENCP